MNNQFLEAFARLERNGVSKNPAWLSTVRKTAFSRFLELGFPTQRNEDWKYTNVSSIERTRFTFEPGGSLPLTAEEIEPFFLGHADWLRLVFVNGVCVKQLSSAPSPLLSGLREAVLSGSRLLEENLTRLAKYEEEPFTALNTALFQDGAFVRIPEGVRLHEPLHLIFISSGQKEPVSSQIRNLILAGKKSEAAVIESFVSLNGTGSFTNAVTEILVEEEGSLDSYKLNQEREGSFHIGTTQAVQRGGSSFTSYSVAADSGFVRNHLNVLLAGEGSYAALNGLYLGDGRAHVDNQTLIDHAKPHSMSRELYKGILDGQSTAAFSGRIVVRTDAQKTDAEQTNKNLILSDEAEVNTKPQLEILADDVKCKHGAAVGQLDEAGIFYLKSRGINGAEARRLLCYGFADEVVGRIKIDTLRERMRRILLHKLANGSVQAGKK